MDFWNIWGPLGELLLLWQDLCLFCPHMKTSHLGLLGLLLAAAPLSACNDTAVGTDTVRTKGLWAGIEVKSTGPSTKLTAKLRVGGSGGTAAYPLTGSDELLFSVGGAPEASLDETCPEDNTFCTGNLGNIGGKKVTVNFDRGSDVENAPSSSVTMPKSFEASAKDDEVVRGNDVEVSLSGDTKSLRYEVSGDCIWRADGTITDGKIPASKIEERPSAEGESCDVTVVVTRTAEGNLDPNFGKGGHIVGIQERSFTFFSVAKATPVPDAGNTTSSEEPTSSDTSAPDASVPDAGDVSSDDAGSSSDGDGGSEGDSSDADASTGAATSGGDSTSGADSSSAVSTSASSASSEAADAGDAG